MAWNGSGIFSRIYNWVSDRDSAIDITSSRMDAEMDGMATGITACLAKNGENAPTATLPMGGFRHTGVGNATALTDYSATGQVQNGSFLYAADSGAADAYIMTLAPAITAYADGQRFLMKASNTNTGASTVNINGLGVKSLIDTKGAALESGDIVSGRYYTLVYNGTSFIVQSGIDGTSDLQGGKPFYYNASGTNTLTATPSPALTAYAAGQRVTLKIANTSTGAVTLNLNSLGAKNVYDLNGSALIAGELVASSIYDFVYDGTQFIVLGLRLDKTIPQNAKSEDYTLAMSDSGKHIFHETGTHTYTIPSNASVPFPIGTTITFVNGGAAGNLTISITSDTLSFYPSGATGSRTLAPSGIVSALKIKTTNWIINGVNLT